MRISIANQPEIERVSSALKQSLTTLVAAIQRGWNVQHNGDGAHTAVTATSLTVTPGLTAIGKLRLSYVTYDEPFAGGTVNDITAPGLAAVSMLRIHPHSNPLLITGIDATGRVPGDLLLVINADEWLGSPCDLQLTMESAGSVATNRFAETTASPTSIGGNVKIEGARGVWLVYDNQLNTAGAGGNNRLRWRVIAPNV